MKTADEKRSREISKETLFSNQIFSNMHYWIREKERRKEVNKLGTYANLLL